MHQMMVPKLMREEDGLDFREIEVRGSGSEDVNDDRRQGMKELV